MVTILSMSGLELATCTTIKLVHVIHNAGIWDLPKKLDYVTPRTGCVLHYMYVHVYLLLKLVYVHAFSTSVLRD